MSMDNNKSWMSQLSLPLLGFGALCLVTAFFLSFAGGETLVDKQAVPASGGVVGPFTIEEGGTVLDVEVEQTLPLQTWSYVSLGLLNENKQWLIGFGGEFWHEAGRGWEEADREYEATLTIPDDGRFYLQVKPDTDMSARQAKGNPIYVEVATQGFSTIPHFGAGILAILLGLIFNVIGGGKLFGVLQES